MRNNFYEPDMRSLYDFDPYALTDEQIQKLFDYVKGCGLTISEIRELRYNFKRSIRYNTITAYYQAFYPCRECSGKGVFQGYKYDTVNEYYGDRCWVPKTILMPYPRTCVRCGGGGYDVQLAVQGLIRGLIPMVNKLYHFKKEKGFIDF